MIDEHDRRIAHAVDEYARLLRALRGLEQETPWFNIELSMAQFKTLALVASTGGMTGRDLAARQRIGPSAVTPLVDRLVQLGFVRREEDVNDRRLSWIRPTSAGTTLYENVGAAGRRSFAQLLADLSLDDLHLVERALDILASAAARQLQAQTSSSSSSSNSPAAPTASASSARPAGATT